MDTLGIEIVIQLCRLQVQREREKLMTPKLRGVRVSMDKLRHALEHDADKLASRIADADVKRVSVFDASHSVLSDVERDLREVEEFVSELEKSNGGPTLSDDSSKSSSESAPRSSEVASR